MIARLYGGEIQQGIFRQSRDLPEEDDGRARGEKMTRQAYRLSVRLALGQAHELTSHVIIRINAH